MSHKYVYLFSEGDGSMRELLGGKGANLAEMTKLGLPVPQGFTISTEACTQYYEDGRQINDEIQAQIMELIRDMNRKMGTAVLLISHDLGVIRQMCSRVYIMYAGRVVESGETQEVLAHPLHPYTKGLIASIPSLEKRGQRLSSIPGTVPALEDRSEHGCPFYNRCQSRRPSCQNETPPMVVHKGHMALCVNAKEELGL